MQWAVLGVSLIILVFVLLIIGWQIIKRTRGIRTRRNLSAAHDQVSNIITQAKRRMAAASPSDHSRFGGSGEWKL